MRQHTEGDGLAKWSSMQCAQEHGLELTGDPRLFNRQVAACTCRCSQQHVCMHAINCHSRNTRVMGHPCAVAQYSFNAAGLLCALPRAP
jgi:hypothetical protein